MSESIAFEKSKKFAVRIMNMHKFLKPMEFNVSKQIVRSGTSIGANLSEARRAVSRDDFINKVYIALKEANETAYWLETLFNSGYLTQAQYESMATDCDEIIKMLMATTKTFRARQNLNSQLSNLKSKRPM